MASSKRIGQFIIIALVAVGLYLMYSLVRGEMLSSVTRTDVVTSGLIAHYTFDGKNIDDTQTSAEVRDVAGTYHGDMITTTLGFAGTSSVGAESADIIFNGESDSSSFGYESLGVGDVNADGYDDFLVGALQAKNTGAATSGRAYLFYGPLTGTSSVDAENADVIFDGTADTDQFGISVAIVGDVDGDGYGDLIIGAKDAEDAGADRGRTYLFFGPFTGTTSIDAQNADVVFNGTTDYDALGSDVSSAGDINADGYADILIGAYGAEDAGVARGRAYLFYGPLTGTTSVNAENADVIFNGTTDADLFGKVLASAGDVNADGYGDIIIGALQAEDTGSSRGQAYLFYGPLTGTSSVDAENADAIFNGTTDGDYFGVSVAGAVDLNADGYDDVVVGAYQAEDTGNNRGRVYVFMGPFNGSVDAENAHTIINGTTDVDLFGYLVSPAEDVNGDEHADLVVGAYAAEDAGTARGQAYLFLGPFTNPASIDAENADVIYNGTTDSDNFSRSVFANGDINGDGLNDLIIGAHQATDVGTNRGRVYLFTPNSYGTREATGKIGQAMEFDGVNGYVDVGNTGSTVETVSFWMKADDVTDRPIISFNTPERIYLDSSGIVQGLWNFPTVYIDATESTSSPISEDQWYHVVVTSGFGGALASNLKIGAYDTTYFKGEIDDVRLYNRVLSQDEIRSLYLLGNTMKINKTRVGYNPTDPLVNGLAAHYSFDGPTISGNTVQDVDPFPYGTFGVSLIDAENADLKSFGESNGDNFGSSVASAGDVNGDGYDDLLVGAYRAEDTGTDRGRSYLFFGPLTGTSSINAENADVVFNGAVDSDYFGFSVSGAGDVNADGYADVFIGAPYAEDVGTLRGRAYLFMGPFTGTTSVHAQKADVVFNGVTDSDYFAEAVAGSGDVNGDGYADLLVGAAYAEDSGSSRGQTYLFLGPFSGVSSVDAENADVVFNGTVDSDNFGNSVSLVGDTDADGYDDVLVGAYAATDAGSLRGRAYLFRGPLTGTSSVNAENADVIFNGEVDSDYYGKSVAGAGDVNGDGYDDLLVGAHFAEDSGSFRGRTYLFFGPLTGTSSINAENADVVFNGAVDSDYFGFSVSGAGDVNADGYSDIIVGAYNAEDTGAARGQSYLFFGPLSGTASVDAENADVIYNGENDLDYFGYSVSSAGDVNGDGYDEVFVGAYWAEDSGGACTGAGNSDCGAVYLFTPFASSSNDSVSGSAAVARGKIGQGIEFNGVGDNKNIGNIGMVKSISFWVKADDVTSRDVFNLKDGGTIRVNINASSQIEGIGWGSPTYYVDAVSGARTIDTDWHHVVITSTTSIEATHFTLAVSTNFYDGVLDDVRVYNRTLTQDDVRQLYLLGGSLKINTTSKPQPARTINTDERMIAHWSFDGPSIQGAYATATDVNLNKLGTFGTSSFDAEDTLVFNGTTDDDWFGSSVSSAGDVNGDGYNDLLIGAYFAEDAGTERGRAYLFYGPLTGTTSIDAENADVILNGTTDVDRFGNTVASAGDVNGDGYDDIFVGAYGAEDTGSNRGRAYLFYGGALGSSVNAEDADVIFNGTTDSDLFAIHVAGVGDVNQDGYVDLVVGAPYAEDAGSQRGRAYLFYGPFTGTTSIDAENADVIINGTTDDDIFGISVANGGDVNSDGFNDILVGAYAAEDAGGACTGGAASDCGRAYLFYGGTLGASINAEDADVIFNGTTDGDVFGAYVASAGDVNADGYGDVLVGADESEDAGTDRGRAYLFYGPFTGTTSIDAENADVIFNGTTDGDFFGFCVSGVGDINQDGYDDLLVGAEGASDTGSERGRAYLFYGGAFGVSINAEDADMIVNGTNDTDGLGFYVANAGDVNGDGLNELLIGAADAEDAGTGRGRAYLFTPYVDAKDGTMNNITPARGKMGQAMEFNGSNSFVNMGDTLDQIGSFSISAWIKADDLSTAGQRIVVKDTGSAGWALSLADGGSGLVRFFTRETSTISLDAGASIKSGEWYHVVAVFDTDADTKRIYINSSIGASAGSITGDPVDNSASLGIGRDPAGSSGTGFDGDIDEVRLYNYALSADEVYGLYLQGK